MKPCSHLKISEVATEHGRKIGYIELDHPKTLNSISLEMAQAMYHALRQWDQDEGIAMVVIWADNEKAFCAGGDIQQLYHSAIASPGGPCEYGEAFFLHEYHLNFYMHGYRKPILSLGHGIVMGGGMGVFMGSSHRVVTENSRLAMPEISIGLFPDVGGTWFLNRIPYKLGYFLALTGAPLQINDALFSGLATHSLAWSERATLFGALAAQQWALNPQDNHALLNETLRGLALGEETLRQLPRSELHTHQRQLEYVCSQPCFSQLRQAILDIDSESPWMNRARESLEAGSPLSSLLIYEQLVRYRYASLREIFLSEYVLAVNILRFREFPEGIRALLIDKDKCPQWTYPRFDQVPASRLNRFFMAPWDENPLAALMDADA